MDLQECYNTGEELNSENLEKYLEEDISFVQFFNSFLTLPVFPQRILYNIVSGIFEQFENRLADDDRNKEGNTIESNSVEAFVEKRRTRIGYYVKFVSRKDGLEWIKRCRLDLFLKSEIYADFKLSKLLGDAQSTFLLNFVKNNIAEDENGKVDQKSGVENKSDVNKKHRYVNGVDISNLPLWQRNQILVSAGFEPDSDDEEDDSGTEDTIDDESNCSQSTASFSEPTENNKCDVIEKELPTLERSKILPRYLYGVPEVENEESISSDENMHDQSSHKINNERNVHFVDSDTELENTRESAIKAWLRKVSRRKSTTEAREEVLSHGRSFMEVECDDNYIDKLLDSANQTSKEITAEPIKESTSDFLKKAELWPMNLSYKQGIDAFKEFLFDTQGEKNILLWLEIERSKYNTNEEKKRTLHHIKDHFIRSGSPFEIALPIRKKWGIENSADITISKLTEISPEILKSLLTYWCQRFTIHQHRRKNLFIQEAIVTACALQKKENLPQRPSTSFNNHLNVYKNDAFSDCSSDSGISCEGSIEFSDNGITRNKIRCKSAYPRLLSTKLPQNTNIGYEQLQLISSVHDEGYGFKSPPVKSYKNDASNLDDKKNVRLYIKPVPPLKSNVSTITSESLKQVHHDDIDSYQSFSNENSLDSLVDMLLHEQFTGQYFLKHLKEIENQHWMNCYFFWNSVREYNDYFYSQSFNPFSVQRKANAIYISFLSDDGEYNIECPKELIKEVTKQLTPPFEELFDKVEQYVLNKLLSPWEELLSNEKNYFSQLKLKDQLKYIEVDKTSRGQYNSNQWKDLTDKNKDGWLTFDDRESDEKISPEELGLPLPTSKDPFNFDLLIRNKSELELFQTFLESKHREGTNDLTAWTDMELFRKLPHTIKDDRDQKAMDIRKSWLSSKYFFGKDSPATNSALKRLLDMCGKGATALPERPSTPVISESQKYIRARVERRWLVLFKETTEYLRRRKRKSSVTEIVEDLIMKKKIQRSEHAWKVLNSRWNSSSREISALRLSLNDPVECEQFRRYIAVKSDLMSNNLNFWLEVQKYKELCHSHVHPTIIQEKLKAIISVFIKSQIPPELQIDVPIEMAERLYDKTMGKNPYHGPYLFREAQATVFRIMFNYWKEFLAYGDNLPDRSHLTQSLYELEKKRDDEILKKKLEQERKRLVKVVTEKKKKKCTSKEKDRSKSSQDLFSYLSRTVETVNNESESTTFLYSQHIAEQELHLVESIMNEHGYLTPEPKDVVDADFSKKRNSKNFSRISISDSIITKGKKDDRGSGKILLSTPDINRQTIRTSSSQSTRSSVKEKSPSSKSLERKSTFEVNRLQSSKTDRRGSSLGKNKQKEDSKNSSLSVHSVLSVKNSPVSNEVVGRNENDRKQPRKSTPSSGSRQQCVLPLIQVSDIDKLTSMDFMTARVEKKAIRKFRIPRNAGTAKLITRLKQEEGKKREISLDSSQEIKPEVIVC